MLVFYKRWKKYNEIQLTKKQNGLQQPKNHPPSPIIIIIIIIIINKIYFIRNGKSRMKFN